MNFTRTNIEINVIEYQVFPNSGKPFEIPRASSRISLSGWSIWEFGAIVGIGFPQEENKISLTAASAVCRIIRFKAPTIIGLST